MALTPTISAPLAGAEVLTKNITTATRLSASGVDVAFRRITPFVQTSIAGVDVLFRGRVVDKRFRSWNFTLDGHEFYVLRLGEIATVVFDMTTGQWSRWDSHGLPCFRGHLGHNWHNAGAPNYAAGMDLPILSGDEDSGIVWAMKAFAATDDPVVPLDPPSPVIRKVGAILPLSGRQSARCNAVYLTVSNGDPGFVFSTVNLRTSDDNGRTWLQRDGKVIEAGKWGQELKWRSLGLMKAPGRIFEFSDNSAAVRIDRLDVRADSKSE